MLYALRRTYQCEVGEGIFLLFSPSFITSWPSSTRPIIPLPGFVRAVSPRSERHSLSLSI